MAACVQIEERVGRYVYIISKTGKPLRLHMLGPELALDSHFDEYVLDFQSFEELDKDDETPFVLPDACHNVSSHGVPRPASLALASLVPHGQVSQCRGHSVSMHGCAHASMHGAWSKNARFPSCSSRKCSIEMASNAD
jgi:hypothetical protein